MVAGGSFAQLLLAGQWHPSAYGLYLDLGVEETKATAAILLEALEDDGSRAKGSEGRRRRPLERYTFGIRSPTLAFGYVGSQGIFLLV